MFKIDPPPGFRNFLAKKDLGPTPCILLPLKSNKYAKLAIKSLLTFNLVTFKKIDVTQLFRNGLGVQHYIRGRESVTGYDTSSTVTENLSSCNCIACGSLGGVQGGSWSDGAEHEIGLERGAQLKNGPERGALNSFVGALM